MSESVANPDRTKLGEEPWPNRREIVDGIVPAHQVSQDPLLFDGDEDDYEMED